MPVKARRGGVRYGCSANNFAKMQVKAGLILASAVVGGRPAACGKYSAASTRTLETIAW